MRGLSGTAGRRLTRDEFCARAWSRAFGDRHAADRHVGRLQIAVLELRVGNRLEQMRPLDGVGRRLGRLQGGAELAGRDLVTNKLGTVRRRQKTGWLAAAGSGGRGAVSVPTTR